MEDDRLKALDAETQKQCEMMGRGQKTQLLESVRAHMVCSARLGYLFLNTLGKYSG